MKGIAYLIQATLIFLWWAVMLFNDSLYTAFQFSEISTAAFNSFFFPDVIVIGLLSLLRAYKKYEKIDFIILGGFAFATLYCINASVITESGWLATTIMILGLCYNLFLVYNKKLFRVSNTENVLANGFKTLAQIICVWAITLFLFPLLILNSFDVLIDLNSTNLIVVSIVLILFSLLGLYSAFTMVVNGKGTPLPLDQNSKTCFYYTLQICTQSNGYCWYSPRYINKFDL